MMMMKKLLAGAAALALIAGAAWGAGQFQGYPIVGAPAYCEGVNVTGSQCTVTVPAGPAGLTGTELVPADTQLAAGANPQTVNIPSSLLTYSTSVNRLIGGDFNTNPAQRLSTTKGIASLATLSPTAAVITADRWWVIAPAAGVTVTIDSTAATAVIPGFNNTKALRLARTTSGAAGIACIGQTLDQAASLPLIGNNAVFSFWESQGAGNSAAGGNFTVNVDYTSAADAVATQATLGFAGANGSLFALGDVGLLSAGPTNMTRAIAGFSPGTTGTVAAGVATIAGSATWNRYSVYAPIPINVPGTTTPVTSVSVSICTTFVATTAITTDWIEIEGAQLEAKPSTPTSVLPAGVTSPSAFERRTAAQEQALAYSYWYYNFENQTAIVPVAPCTDVSITVANCELQLPFPMRIIPIAKYTTGFQLFTTTAYSAVGACTTLSNSASYATVPSAQSVLMNCTAGTVPAAGTANNLTTLGTSSATGIIVVSAEP
jgi:hypothetical protein